MAETTTEFECALTGMLADEDDLILDAADGDDLEEQPIGWIRVTIERRGVNPAYVALLQAKERLLANALAGTIPPDMPAEDRAVLEADIRLSVDAQFFAIEQGTPKYVTHEDVVYIRNPDGDKQVSKAWGEIAAVLGTDVGLPAKA